MRPGAQPDRESIHIQTSYSCNKFALDIQLHVVHVTPRMKRLSAGMLVLVWLALGSGALRALHEHGHTLQDRHARETGRVLDKGRAAHAVHHSPTAGESQTAGHAAAHPDSTCNGSPVSDSPVADSPVAGSIDSHTTTAGSPGSDPHPTHDETNCSLHAALQSPVILAGVVAVLIERGLFVAFVNELCPPVQSQHPAFSIDCRGPPVPHSVLA